MDKRITAAVILAAGCGSRMMSDITKQRMEIHGTSVLKRSVLAFENTPEVDSIVVVVREDEIAFAERELDGIKKVVAIVSGGRDRRESARCGFSNIPSETEFVAIHDAARCLITPKMISDVLYAAYCSGAATASTPITDTVKKIDGDGIIVETFQRESLVLAQTPQVFAVDIYSRALSSDIDGVTDDNMLVESIGVKVTAVDTGKRNIKITTPEDLLYAEFLLGSRGE